MKKFMKAQKFLAAVLMFGVLFVTACAEETPAAADSGMSSAAVKNQSSADAVSLEKATVWYIFNQVYTGKAVTPAPTVYYGDKRLEDGTDYTVTYKNNKKAGEAQVAITGKGGYTGTVYQSFNINKSDSVPSEYYGTYEITDIDIDGKEYNKKDFDKIVYFPFPAKEFTLDKKNITVGTDKYPLDKMLVSRESESLLFLANTETLSSGYTRMTSFLLAGKDGALTRFDAAEYNDQRDFSGSKIVAYFKKR